LNDLVKVVILAVIQGVAEFLPVSSSGHLVLSEYFLGLEQPGNFLEIALHAGTLVSILVYYRKRIINLGIEFIKGGEGRSYGFAVIIGSVPAALAYFLFNDSIEASFENPVAVAFLLCMTGMVLLTLRLGNPAEKPIGLVRAFLVGIAQAVALLPGISRSGMTITAARHLGISPAKSAEFSFIMLIPALSGACLIKLINDGIDTTLPLSIIGAGMAVAAIIGYASLSILEKTLKSGWMWMFGLYCLIAGLASGFLMK
jgi:undecaprenyl-diphosphatase